MKERNSSIEILRAFCIFGILIMHSLGRFLADISGINLGIAIFVNSVFNMTSMCLILISGYYGLHFSMKKVLNLELLCLFWSVTDLALSFAQGLPVNRNSIICALFPTLTSKSWFVTGYMILLIFSDFVNDFLDSLDEDRFRRFLLIMIIIFFVAPTIIYIDIFGTGGKDIIHLFVAYVLGRYIRKYRDKEYNPRSIWLCLSGVIITAFICNLVTETMGVRFWFCRDCSVFMLAEAVMFFLLLKDKYISSKIINYLFRNILSVLLGERVALFLWDKYFIGCITLPDDYELWTGVLLSALFAFVFGIAVEKIRSPIADAIISQIIRYNGSL